MAFDQCGLIRLRRRVDRVRVHDGCQLGLQFAKNLLMLHAGDQIDRLVTDLREMGQLDNTVIMVLGDNGAF